MPTLLLVDDDIHFCRMMKEMLTQHGYKVQETHSGTETLLLLDTKAIQPIPDVLLVDFHMPGMNGLELVQELRKRESMRGTPIIMLTATQKDIREIVESEGVSFMQKTSDHKTLLKNLHQLTGGPRDIPISLATGDAKTLSAAEKLLKNPLPLNQKLKDFVVRALEKERAPRRLGGSVDSTISELMDKILEHAISQQTAQIEIDPIKDGSQLSFRTGESFEPMFYLTRTLGTSLVTHIETMANLNIVEMGRPQQGAWTWQDAAGNQMDLKVIIFPSVEGEKLILRLSHNPS